MKKHLFLQGQIGVGKSTIIRNLLFEHLDEIGGFFTQRIFIGQRYVGFALNPISNKEEYNIDRYVNELKEVNNVFLYCDDDGKWNINNDVFINYAIPYLKTGLLQKKLILLDEIGGVELKCIPFMNEIIRVLEDNIPVLGVLKSEESKLKLQKKLKDSNNIINSPNFFYKSIKENPNVEILYLNKENYLQSKNKVENFVNEVFNK